MRLMPAFLVAAGALAASPAMAQVQLCAASTTDDAYVRVQFTHPAPGGGSQESGWIIVPAGQTSCVTLQGPGPAMVEIQRRAGGARWQNICRQTVQVDRRMVVTVSGFVNFSCAVSG